MRLLLLVLLLFCGGSLQFTILQLADFHLDVDYSIHGDTSAMCHETKNSTNNTLGTYGDYMCASPQSLVAYTLDEAKRLFPSPDMILWTGDNTPHAEGYDWDYVYNAVQLTTSLILSRYSNVSHILPTFGNHDYAPSNAFDQYSQLYAYPWDLWTPLIGESQKVRPALRHDIPINVSFVFALTQIIDVDERNQILTTNAWVRQQWDDYKMVWDPREYQNVTRIHVPYETIWKPDIILYNNADSQYTKSVMSTDVVVDYLGRVTWASAAIFKSSCPLDVKHYPFDKQTCTLKYASWAYDGTKIDLVLTSEKGDTSNYMMSTEWNLLFIRAEKNAVIYSCCPDAPYPFVDIHISIERRPMFYVFNLILPCVLISGIALLGFYMPSDSGEKVTLGGLCCFLLAGGLHDDNPK